MIQLEPLACQVFDDIIAHGGKVYIVGGSVRDDLLGLESSHDIDVEVYHLHYAVLEEILGKYGQVKTFGKQFAIMKLKSLPDYDFALPRHETKTGSKHQDFEIIVDPDLPLEKAIIRRDLTINALMYDYSTKQVIDLCHGIDDLKQGIIRVVNEDKFIEDPLRVLRAARFLAKLNMRMDPKTESLCQKMVEEGMLEELSKERVYQEYSLILMCKQPSIAFRFLLKIGALPKYLSDLDLTPQRKDYHPEGNVFEHTMLVVDEGAKVKKYADHPLWFMWSCLLHDIGKPSVTTPDLHSPNHALVGAQLFNELSIIQSKEESKYIYELIAHHMQLIYIARKKNDYKYLLLLREIAGKTSMNDLFLISYCDKMGRGIVQQVDIDILMHYQKYVDTHYGKDPIPPFVNGNDLLNIGCPKNQIKKYMEESYAYQLNGLGKWDILEEIKKKVRR